MGVHSKFDRLQDEYFDVQISATHALACLELLKRNQQGFLLEQAEKSLRECASNHYLAELIRVDALFEHHVRELRADRKQLQLL